MLIILQNQQICRRKRPQGFLRVQQPQHNRQQKVKRQRVSVSADKRKKPVQAIFSRAGRNTIAARIPLIAAIVFCVICIGITTPHIFSLTASLNTNRDFKLPEETILSGYTDGFAFVQNLRDERVSQVVAVSKTVVGQTAVGQTVVGQTAVGQTAVGQTAVGQTTVNETGNEKSPHPDQYVISNGDTIYSISKEYNLSLYRLIRENRIADPTKLKAGDIIKLPAGVYQSDALSADASKFGNASKSEALLPDDVAIAAQSAEGFLPFKATLSIKTKTADKGLSYMWVLGNDRYSFERSAAHTYNMPGNYDVFLIVSDKNNNEVVSNKVTIRVKKKNIRTLHIDSGTTRFITIGQVNDILEFSSLVHQDSGMIGQPDIKIKQEPELFQEIGEGRLLSIKAGYGKVIVETKERDSSASVFISPYPSKHSFEPPYNWYKTQFATGINGNCGPASAAMAIYWAKGEDLAVAKARSEIGLPFGNGAIDYKHLVRSLKKHSVAHVFVPVDGFPDIKKIIDRGNIAIAVFNTGSISKCKGDPQENLIGRYYDDITGHYCIIKGYTLDNKYFIVYDPIPSDWTKNTKRYADGESMIGKNRYYPASELFRSIGSKVIEVKR